MAKTDPTAIVAEAAAKTPVSIAGGILMAMLFGIGGLSLVSGLATQQWSGAVTGALCVGMGVFITYAASARAWCATWPSRPTARCSSTSARSTSPCSAATSRRS